MNKKFTSLPTIYPEELSQKGMAIYEKISKQMEKKNFGKYLAIEVESRKYFVGNTLIEAMEKAKKQFPDKLFYFIRAGFPGVFTLSRQHLPTPYGNIF